MIETRLKLDEDWELDDVVPFDSFEGKTSYLMRGKNALNVKLSPSAYSLLKAVHSGKSFAEFAQAVNKAEKGTTVTESELRSKYEAVLGQLHQIREQSDMAAGVRLPWGYRARLCLIPKSAVARIAAFLSYLYHPASVVCCMFLLMAALATAFRLGSPLGFENNSLLPGLGLFTIAMLAHELGHASACMWFGEAPSEIGFTIYLIYPAFYSDVSCAWRLRRRQRVVVDLGGCYFQSIISCIFLFAYYATRWEPLRACVTISLFTALFSLNPIFKFDGYWMLADLLGVANLTKQPRRIGRFILDSILRKSPEPLPWPKHIVCVLVAYSTVAPFVWVRFVLRLLPMMGAQLILAARTLPLIVAQAATGKMPSWHQFGSFVFSLLQFAISFVLVWSIALAMGRILLRATASRRTRHGLEPTKQGTIKPA